MMESSSSILTWLILLPLVGAIGVALLKPTHKDVARGTTVALGAWSLLITLVLWWRFDPGIAGMQLVHRFAWVPSLGVEYHLAVDGLGLLMVGLTSLVMFMSVLTSSPKASPGYYAFLLFLQSGLYGAFTALNFVHWFLFWELCLIPAYFLIKLYGGGNRSGAAMQFFVYTMVGSIALLVGYLGLYLSTGSFDFTELARLGGDGKIVPAIAAAMKSTGLSGGTAYELIGFGVLLGFAVKVPLMPFHTWLPSTYGEAPTAVTMTLTGVMSKLGLYGLLRLFLPVFPEFVQEHMTLLLGLSVATIVLAAGSALAQRDMKQVLAYSSVNHLGYCLLGVFAVAAAGEMTDKAAALSGVVFQMVSHGITAAALFAFLAFLERRSGGLRGADDFGGLRRLVPGFCGLMGVALFASLGLPGLNGFVGEFLIFKGVFGLSGWAAVVALPGVLITAVFILKLMQQVFHGPINGRWSGMPDLDARERLVVLPAIVLMFLLGVFPGVLLHVVNPTVVRIIGGLNLP